MNIDLVKGGHDISAELEDRLAVSQRPADGHVKSAIWEDYSILTAGSLNCNEGAGTLEKGDFIALHTTPSIGFLEYLGIAVEGAVEGLELEMVAMHNRERIDINYMRAYKAIYNKEYEMYDISDTDINDHVGSKEVYVNGFFERPYQKFIRNTEILGFIVRAVPDHGNIEGMRIVTRMQYSQPARTPAYLGCCGGRDTVINPSSQ